MIISIIDLGINNLGSIFRFFNTGLKPGESTQVFNPKDKELLPSLVVIPGMGNFGYGMQSLHDQNLIERLTEWKVRGVKILGVCLGMQLLGSISQESPERAGLGFIKGKSLKLPDIPSEKVPNVGWCSTKLRVKTKSFSSLESKGDYYFVHSYHFVPDNPADILAISEFGNKDFASAVKSDNVLGFQFHPEKSGAKGKILRQEIVEWVKNES